MPQRKFQKNQSPQAGKLAEARAKRAMNLAMLPLATLAISGCSTMGTLPAGGPGAARNETTTLLKAEETIAHARGLGNSNTVMQNASPNEAALKYAQAVDAALNSQPQGAAKVEQTKKPAAAPAVATVARAPKSAVATPAASVAPAKAGTSASVSMYVAPVESKAGAAPVVLASHNADESPKAEAKPEPKVEAKVEPKVESKAETKVEPKIEPKAEAVAQEHAADSHDPHEEHVEAKAEPKAEPKVEAKVESKSEAKSETKIEPKVEAKSEIKQQPKLASAGVIEPKIEKIEKDDRPAIAAAMPELKGAAAMGAMTITNPPAEERLSIAGAAEPDVTMEAIVSQLRKQVHANPRQLNVALALSLLEGTSADAHANDSAASPLSEADQKIVGSITGAISAVMQTPANASLSEKAASIIAASKKLEGDGDLQLPKLVLTSRVDSYGVYSPVEARFENGKRHTVIIYCEVANFSTRKTDDGFFTTKLSQQDSLITEDGLLVWRPNPEEVEDRSRNQRHDFYLVKKLTLPESLALGKYTLRMSVTDKQTNKISMVSIPVEIVDSK